MTYSLTPKGKTALTDKSVSIILPVPESILEAERVEKARRERVLAQLEKSGVQLDKLPEEELQTGDGEVIRALSKWKSYLAIMQRNGKKERIKQLESLLAGVQKWREEAAEKLHMAPSTVLAEHTLFTLAYTAGTMPAGTTLVEADLMAAGVRTRAMDSLCQMISEWVDKHQQSASESNGDGSSMRLIPGDIVKGPKPWEYAVCKPIKKTGLASWESSYNRFSQGESPLTIALSPANGRPIQVATVCKHVMQALLYGKGVDLHRLAQFLPPPTSSEWDQLLAAEEETKMDPSKNPNSCTPEGDKFTMTGLLKPIMGDDFFAKSYEERSDEEKAEYGKWCNHLEWYMTLRRIGHTVTFGQS
mgnify:CR=1 FL=1